jgi:uncharacterized membrane protein
MTPKDKIKEKIALSVLWLSVSAYVIYFNFLCLLKYNSFSYHDFDLAVHALSVWNILHGTTFNSILGLSFLGNHMQPILFLVAPVYAVFPHPQTLLILQTLFLGAGAVPLYLIAKRQVGLKFALIIALGYLLYPGLAFTNLFEFHPTSFATFFLMVCLYAYDFNKVKTFLVFSLLAMLCQENIALAIIMFGIMALFEKRARKWVFVPFVIGIVYFIPSLILLKHFNQGTIQFSSLYSHLGDTPIEAITNPLLSLRFLMRKESFGYIFNIFSPVLFIPFFAWIKLLPAAPLFLQHLLSSRASDLSIHYHYTAEIIPFIFFSILYSIKRLLSFRFIKRYIFVFSSVLVVFILFSASVYGPYIKESFKVGSDYRKDQLDLSKEELIKRIPISAGVVATFELLPSLANRDKLYSLHHPYMGFYTLSNKKYSLPKDAEYALIDFNDKLTFRSFYRPDGYKNLQEIFINNKWQVLGVVDSLVLLKKSLGNEDFICNKESLSGKSFMKEVFKVEDSISLLNIDIKCSSGEDFIEARIIWKSLKNTDKDIQMFIKVTDNNGMFIKSLVHPICYRILPTQSWNRGEVFSESLRVYIPRGFLKNEILVVAGFYDYAKGNMLRLNLGGKDFMAASIGSIRCE